MAGGGGHVAPAGGGGHAQGGYDPVLSAKQLAQNKQSAWIYAAAFSCLIMVFIVSHFTRTLFQLSSRRMRTGQRGMLGKIVVAPFRLYRRVMLRKVPKVTSGGHLLLILVYMGMNVAITLYDQAPIVFPYAGFAKRCGWMAVTNACLAFLLAMKNNPLAFLTGYSHERLNVLHRWVGRAIFVFSCLHVYVYTAYLVQRQSLAKLTELQIIWGWVAFGAFNVLYVGSLQWLRKRHYEIFYMIHVLMFLVAVIFLGLHKPHKFAPVMYAVGAFWCMDRLIRTTKMMYYSYGNTATLIPLSGLATKVILKRPVWSQPGSHAFLSIPSIQKIGSHPFTIASSNPHTVEFVIKAQKGFTLALHKYALKNPGIKVRACFDGPYGALPDFGRFNKVVLVAGGSGGAFTFPIAMDLLRNAGRFNVVKVELIWVVRDQRHLTWFESEISELQRSDLVNLSIYVTSKTDPIVSSQPPQEEVAMERDVRNSLYIDVDADINATLAEIGGKDGETRSINSSGYSERRDSLGALPDDKFQDADIEKATAAHLDSKTTEDPSTASAGSHLRPPLPHRRTLNRNSIILESQIDATPSIPMHTIGGRPDISSIVRQVVDGAESRDMVAVAACGPVELMRMTRNAVAEGISLGGASVTLHCEQFGWG